VVGHFVSDSKCLTVHHRSHGDHANEPFLVQTFADRWLLLGNRDFYFKTFHLPLYFKYL